MIVVAIGMIGATVMPHNLYLHSALVQTRKIKRDESSIRREALRLKIPCLTNLSAALAACEAVETLRGDMTVRAIQSLG